MPDTEAELTARLAAVRAKRGYLLPHHGLLALAFPDLLAGYDAAYTAMALADRVLSHHDREFVWLAVLAATDEALATHHIAKFRAASGDDAGISAAFAAAAWAIGAEAHDFAAKHWAAQIAPWDPRAAYLDGVRRLAPLRLVHLAQLSVHVCNRRGSDAGDVPRLDPPLRRGLRRLAEDDRGGRSAGERALSHLGEFRGAGRV
jgi:hypothetical protein